MVKYYEIEGRIVKLADDEVTPTFHCYVSIDNYVLIEEDGIFNDKEVHKGDVIIIFYDKNKNGNREYIILDKNNYITDKILKIKEREAKAKCECASSEYECICSDKT